MLRPPSSFFKMSDYQTAVYSAECHKPYLISCNMFAFVDPQPCLTKRTFKGRRSRVSFANATQLDTKVHWQSITSVWILCILSKCFEIQQLCLPSGLGEWNQMQMPQSKLCLWSSHLDQPIIPTWNEMTDMLDRLWYSSGSFLFIPLCSSGTQFKNTPFCSFASGFISM